MALPNAQEKKHKKEIHQQAGCGGGFYTYMSFDSRVLYFDSCVSSLFCVEVYIRIPYFALM